MMSGAGEENGGVSLKPLESNGKEASMDKTEKDKLVTKKRQLSAHTASNLRLGILIISWISVVGLGILGLTTLIISILNNSSASFAFALDAWLDCISSMVVIWRFSSAAKLYSEKREKIACIALGCLFIISSIIIITKSSISIQQASYPEKSNLIWYLSIVNGIACFFLAASKAYYAKRLESIAVATDAINSVIGFILAVSTLVSDIVYTNNNNVWYMDAVVGIICSFFLLAYGIWVIVFETVFTKGYDDLIEEE